MNLRRILPFLLILALLVIALAGTAAWWRYAHRIGPDRGDLAWERQEAQLTTALAQAELTLGAPVFLRAFKADDELEVWMRHSDGHWILFLTLPICRWSGDLGPKLREGDRQTPEGVYRITPDRLHRWTRYHLAFHLNYPNERDRAHGHTGSHIMIHGRCVSIGCLAMTDDGIELLWVLVDAALEHTDEVPVHIFPARDLPELVAAASDPEHRAFWEELLPILQAFHPSAGPPAVAVVDGRYTVQATLPQPDELEQD